MEKPNIDNYIDIQDYFDDLEMYKDKKRARILVNTVKMIGILIIVVIIIKLI